MRIPQALQEYVSILSIHLHLLCLKRELLFLQREHLLFLRERDCFRVYCLGLLLLRSVSTHLALLERDSIS